ncbi:MAG: NADPH-dependent glutamate synthase [Firmicutes bacterium]|nr:NADPH-dependent glutamate synthase [Bacillota bacterium]
MRQQMPKQDPQTRRSNFTEVAQGFTAEQAQAEAKRCLNCKKPLCVEGCPVEIDIPKFIALLVDGKPDEALAKIKEKKSLPAICGRGCPQENQCEKNCILGRKGEPVAIGSLERYCADWGRARQGEEPASATPAPVKGKVAVVGSGPAGLTAAADLALLGYQVTLFESLHAPGGVLRYGIPEFRLPKAIVDYEVGNLIKLGVEIKTNVLIGKTLTIDELFATGHQAVFIGTGAGLPYFLGIPGENLNGVYSANEFLTRVNLMKAYRFPEFETPIRIGKRVAVVGAGNVAMDSARTALRLGAEEVTIVYRRSREEMPARLEEIENAEEEGVIFRLLTNPVRLLGDESGNVTTMVCQKMALGEPDASGRRKPVPIPGSEEELAVDTVIVAIGQGPNPILLQGTTGLALNRRGYIEVDPETLMTSIPGVFAGGDIVTGAATVIAAMGAGKRAARSIDQYLTRQKDCGVNP